MIYNSNNSFLYYKDNLSIVDDYYQNIVNIIKKILINNPDLNINIILCDSSNYNIDNNNKTLKIHINFEHTLVKNGGRSIPEGTPFGNVDYDINKKYLVRIVDILKYSNSEIIIDYSIPNIYNINSCSLYEEFSKKNIYISSSIYEPYFLKENRNILTLTTFINTNEPRRKELFNKINNEKIEHININNCFDKNNLQNILKNTKILINIHQTPHHHTFEELRVLPALECGVIVISEKSPLYELIPYNNLIIWANYDDIIEKTKEIINNYDFFHNKIFSIENMTKLCNLQKLNYNKLENQILQEYNHSNL
jgi:hypothetical protein